MTLNHLVHGIVLAWSWRRRSIAFTAGAVSALAMAPFNAWPVLFLTFPVLVFLIDGVAGRGWSGLVAAADIGWCFGFGYFLAGLYWLGYAFLVDAATFGWLLPFAVIGLPAILAIYTARGAVRILALAACLTATEWLRGHLFTGFPWNAFGHALTAPLALAQAASVLGLWGLTFIAVAVAASPATLFDQNAEKRRPLLPVTLAVLTLAALGSFGAVRLAQAPTRLVDGVHLRIMQPNLQQDVRFNYAARHEVVDRYLALSARQGLDQVTKAFGKRTVIEKVDFTVNPGELIEITGASGAGKSTLLRILHGQLRPTAGEVWVEGRALHKRWRRDLAAAGRLPGAGAQPASRLPVQT